MGVIESRERGTRRYLIQLNAGLDDDAAREKLAKIPGVHPLEPREEPLDLNSVKSLDRKIAHLMREEKEENGRDRGKNAKRKKDEVDYLKAYRYFIGQRAFPRDSVDWGAYRRAKNHVATMASANLGWSGTGIRPASAQTWSFVGPTNLQVPYEQYYGVSPVNGRVNAVAYDPNNSQTIYAGGAQGGVWKTTDSGVTWTWLSSAWDELGVNCIVIDPTNSDTIYVGRGDYHGYIAGSYGMMKSTDGGATWTEIAEAAMGKVGVDKILMDPTNSQTLIAGTGDINSYGYLYRSTNGGQTWTKLFTSGTDFEWPALAASAPVGTTTRFYAVAAGIASSTGAASRVYKSDDHGQTWQLLSSTISTDGTFHYAYCVATSPTNPSNVYVLDSENQMLLTSSDQGGSWSNVSANLPTGNDVSPDYNWSQNYYDYHLECGTRVNGASNNDLLFLGEIDVTESSNGGQSWVSIGGPTYEANAISHNDQHCLAVNPTNPNQAVFSNDGGVYSLSYNTTNGRNTVTPLNQNLGVSMFYKIAFHPTNPNYMLGGTQDNASPLSIGDLSNWQNVGGGDGGGSAINQVNPLLQYTTSEDLTVYETSDGWNQIENDISPLAFSSENLPFVATMTLDPSNQSLMYIGTNYLYQWNQSNFDGANPSSGWTNRLGNKDLTNGSSIQPTLEAIAVAPTDSNRIYTGSADGALWMTTTQGATWVHLNPNTTTLPNQAITSISVSPYDENDILVAFSGTSQSNPHLLRCTNTLAKTIAFTNVSGSGVGGLPDISLNAIARDLDNPSTTWWVAMDAGVFVTTNSGQSWSNAGSSAGLPNVIVDDLVSVPGTRYLNAGTYGRGMWRLPLPQGTLIASLASCTVTPSVVSPGGTASGAVTLSSAAPTGGLTVTLSSSVTSAATVPATVTVPAGSTSATFSITANPAATGTKSTVITATSNGVSFPQDVTVTVPALASLTLSPATVTGGGTVSATVSFSSAPPSGAVVSLSSSLASVTVPSTVTIPASASTATFTISTSIVTKAASAIITAKVGTASKTATLTVAPVSIQSITISPSLVVGGSQGSVTATVTIDGVASSGGATVTLSSSNTKAATVPASVKIPAGSSSATFAVTPLVVTTPLSAVIKATFGGVSQSTPLLVNPLEISSLIITPTSAVGGTSASGVVTLATAVGSKAVTIKLTSSTTKAVVPSTVSVTPGSQSASFTIKTSAVATTTVANITSTLGSSIQKTSLTLQSPTLLSLAISPASVKGSSTTKVTGTVAISSAAPVGGFVVKLTISNTSAATVPASVTIAAGKLTGTFTVTHKKVAAQASVTLTATQGTASQTGTLLVTP